MHTVENSKFFIFAKRRKVTENNTSQLLYDSEDELIFQCVKSAKGADKRRFLRVGLWPVADFWARLMHTTQ